MVAYYLLGSFIFDPMDIKCLLGYHKLSYGTSHCQSWVETVKLLVMDQGPNTW